MEKKNAKTDFKVKILALIFIIAAIFFNQDFLLEESGNIIKSQIENIENQKEQKIYELKLNEKEFMNNDIELVFCPSNKCLDLFQKSFEEAKNEIKCAFYELDENTLAKTLLNKSNEIEISLVIDNKYLEEEHFEQLKNTNINIHSDTKRNTRFNNYMHHKFCVIDNETLILGSANPTENGFFKNNNNILKIKSKYLVKNYENEFDQMFENNFGTNKISTLEYNNITLIFDNNSYLISSFMCPQDNCDKIILDYLNNSNEEILFASFAITHDDIENLLVEKHNNNISVLGIIERRNINTKGSRVKELNEIFEIKNDTNKNNMHHKFWIIDEKIVITGSMNPSKSGAKYNDENILVIENNNIAKMFKEEFIKITS